MSRPRTLGRYLGAVAVTLAAMAGLAVLSQAPYAHEGTGVAELRLAWRARSARVDACRQRTPEELARLPVHMRQALVCERRVAPYRLTVSVQDSVIVNRLVTAAGARADRPLYVFEEFALAPGTYHVRLAFTRQHDAATDSTAARDPHAAPPRLTLDTTVTLPAGRAVLVTYDENIRRLHLVTEH